MNQREQIISLFRGRYAVPVISALSELGLLERMLGAPFRVDDLMPAGNERALSASLSYLQAIGIFDSVEQSYSVTDFGRRVLIRAGSANILESYREYFYKFSDVLANSEFTPRKTDRILNIQGSGSLHRAKFFVPGAGLFPEKTATSLIDIGCGDGSFIDTALQFWSDITQIIALDISPDAVDKTIERFKSTFRGSIRGVVGNGADVEVWASELPPANGPEILSSWFVVHEFCQDGPGAAVRFFEALHRTRPKAELLIGEIVATDPETLSLSRSMSIMPEFLLFHALSGQRPLSWNDWTEVRKAIPYRVAREVICDPIPNGATEIPASFVWRLVPEH